MNHKEIEYKYWASEELNKHALSDRLDVICMKTDDMVTDMIYVVSCDDYYTNNSGDGKDFIRFRKGGGRYELTLKRKEKENVVRKEINLNLNFDGIDHSSVEEFLELLGYTKAFQIYKEAWIWHTPKCDISFYTLSDGRSVIELEALNYTSTKQGIATIDKWEKLLKLKSLKKESRSLYEIYTQENNL